MFWFQAMLGVADGLMGIWLDGCFSRLGWVGSKTYRLDWVFI